MVAALLVLAQVLPDGSAARLVVRSDLEVVLGVRHQSADAVPRLRQQIVGH